MTRRRYDTQDPALYVSNEKVLKGEIERLSDEKLDAGVDIMNRMGEIRELLPRAARGRERALILRALIYCREKITDRIEPDSFVLSVLKAAEFGLAIDGRLAHALPFANKKDEKAPKGKGKNPEQLPARAQKPKKLIFVPDYKGMICVAKWRNLITDARAYVVHEGDEFEAPYEDENGTRFRYRETIGKRGRRIGALAILDVPGGGPRRPCFIAEPELKKIRACAKTEMVWSKWEGEMYKKAAMRRTLKLFQDDATIQDLVSADNEGFDMATLDEPAPTVALPEQASPGYAPPPTYERPEPIEVRSDPAPPARSEPTMAPPGEAQARVAAAVAEAHDGSGQFTSEIPQTRRDFDPAPPVQDGDDHRSKVWDDWSQARKQLVPEEMEMVRKEFGVEQIDTSLPTDVLRRVCSFASELITGRRE